MEPTTFKGFLIRLGGGGGTVISTFTLCILHFIYIYHIRNITQDNKSMFLHDTLGK